MHSVYISISLQTWMLYSDSICEIAGFAKVLIFPSKYDLCVRNIKSSPEIRRDSLTSSSGGSIKLHCFISFDKKHFFSSLQKQLSCSSQNIFILYLCFNLLHCFSNILPLLSNTSIWEVYCDCQFGGIYNISKKSPGLSIRGFSDRFKHDGKTKSECGQVEGQNWD